MQQKKYYSNSSTECKTLGMSPNFLLVSMRKYASASHALIASMELATKILRKLVCTSREAPRFLALDRVFRQQQLTRSFSLPEGAIKLASLPEIYLLVLSISTKMA